MKLSEAIRLGAMMGPQVFGDLFDGNGGSCAIGAASKAIGAEVSATFNWLFSERITCPECSLRDTQFFIILCLNDIHHWSRERIADWVQTIEPEEVHASETNGQCSLGTGPKRPTPEVETFETITK